MNIYIQRFISKTPKALVKIQKLFATLTLSIGGALAFMVQQNMIDLSLFKILSYCGVAVAFAIPILQFATEDKNLQNQ